MNGNASKLIKEECLRSASKDPIMLILEIMQKDFINIHGPEHHILDGSCFLTTLHNAGMEFDLEKALDELAERGSLMPGAICGMWGVCGSAASVGAALSIIHKTGPLSCDEYYKDNLKLTSQILSRIGETGGPRCCKRNAFFSLTTAVDFVNENYDVVLEKTVPHCIFSSKNEQCIGKNCPFHN